MTGIQLFKSVAGNIRQSQMARDMNLYTNGEFFFQEGRIVAKMLENRLLAISSTAGLKIPMYLKRERVAHFRPILQ